MVIRKGCIAGLLLVVCSACGGGQSSRSAAVPPTSAAGPSAPHETKAAVAAPALSPPKPGPVAFRCDPGGAPSPEPSPQVAAPTPDASETTPADKARVTQKSRTLPWRRLTPPLSVGAPYVQELVALGSTLVAAGAGIQVSVDEGKTFVDASENVDRTLGNAAHVYDLTVAGDELLAVSEKALYRSAGHGTRWFRCADAPPHPEPKRIAMGKRRVTHGAGVAYTSVGSRLFTSVDAGKTWVGAPVEMRDFTPDGLIATDRGLYAWNSGNIGSLHRSTDHGASWKYIRGTLSLQEGEGITTVAAANGKLYVSTMLGGLLESTDGGDHWSRRWLGNAPSYQAPRPHRVWGADGALLMDAGLGLLRLEGPGKPVRVTERRALGIAVRGRDVFALGSEYLSRSTDAGRTFQDARFAGLRDDSVLKVSASGKNLGIIASGPTAFFSVDGGVTFQRGPEVVGHPEVAAVADGIYFSTTKGEGAVVLFQPAAGGPARQVGVGQAFGAVPPAILGANAKTLFLYVWGKGRFLLSRDAGDTFTELPNLELSYSSRDPGLVRDDEILVAPSGYLYRSRGGAPFERLARSLGPKRQIALARALYAAGPITYIVGPEDVVAWNTKTDQMTSLGKKIPRNREQREWIHIAAVHGKTILAQVRSTKRVQLYLSRDRGASYQEVDGPEGWDVQALAPSEAGILAAGKGLWLLPAQGG